MRKADYGRGRLVVRIDSPSNRTHGWHARVYALPVKQKPYRSRLFSDGRYGGKRPALEAAERWVRRTPRPVRA